MFKKCTTAPKHQAWHKPFVVIVGGIEMCVQCQVHECCFNCHISMSHVNVGVVVGTLNGRWCWSLVEINVRRAVIIMINSFSQVLVDEASGLVLACAACQSSACQPLKSSIGRTTKQYIKLWVLGASVLYPLWQLPPWPVALWPEGPSKAREVSRHGWQSVSEVCNYWYQRISWSITWRTLWTRSIHSGCIFEKHILHMLHIHDKILISKRNSKHPEIQQTDCKATI